MTTGRRNRDRLSAPRAGFTLIELILVMLVISVVMVSVAPQFRGFFESRRTENSAVRVLAMARWAASAAVSTGRTCRLYVDPAGSCYLRMQQRGAFADVTDGPAEPFRVPDDTRIAIRGTPSDAPANCVRFFPDGRHDIGTFEVRGAAQDVVEVVCDASTESYRIVTPAEGSR